MSIEWNKVTWYSKLLVAILFVGIFFLGMYFGGEYERVKQSSKKTTVDSSLSISSSTSSRANIPSSKGVGLSLVGTLINAEGEVIEDIQDVNVSKRELKIRVLTGMLQGEEVRFLVDGDCVSDTYIATGNKIKLTGIIKNYISDLGYMTSCAASGSVSRVSAN